MRVIVINDFAHVNGGAAYVAIASAVGLARRGHRVSFFSAVEPVDARLIEADVEVVCTGQYQILEDPNRLRAACQGLWNSLAGRQLSRQLATVRPDETVIHVHGWSKALSGSVVRTAVGHGFRLVCTLHDYFAACPNGGFFDYQSLSHCHLKPGSLRCIARNCDPRSYSHKLWRVGRHFVQRTVGRLPDGIDAFVVLSHLSCKLLRPYLPENAQIFDIPNPIGVSKEPPVAVGQNRNFLMIGRLSTEKGVSLFARAARDSAVQAIFVGDGPCRGEIECANPSAKVTGWIPHSEVSGYLRGARALVFPSVWYEAQPLATLEAAARGVPAVVSDGCAATESVVDGVTGLLFKDGDAQSLAKALNQLTDDDYVERLGRNAYDRYWSEPPTLERHVMLLERAYETVLRQPKALPVQ